MCHEKRKLYIKKQSCTNTNAFCTIIHSCTSINHTCTLVTICTESKNLELKNLYYVLSCMYSHHYVYLIGERGNTDIPTHTKDASPSSTPSSWIFYIGRSPIILSSIILSIGIAIWTTNESVKNKQKMKTLIRNRITFEICTCLYLTL